MKQVVVLSIHVMAALVPFAVPSGQAQKMNVELEGWPAVYEERRLIPIEPDAVEARFADRFPGQLARFTDGRRQLVFRYLKTPSRQLHAAADCFRGAGYKVEPQPLRRDGEGKLMGCILAERDDRTMRVCERVFDAHGGSWYDVSSWYWSAVLRQSAGPWWAVTVAEET